MSQFDFAVLPEAVAYSGRELRRGWVARMTGITGDAAAGFIGPCHVATEDLVDMDDARAGETIVAAEMAHVIVEHPGADLSLCVLRQRLLVCILSEVLGDRGVRVRRDGDDLFHGDRKLTVSIAAPAPGACLIHLGVNVDPGGAPVPAIGLKDMGLDAREVLDELLRGYRDELATAHHAEHKVRMVD